MLHAATTLGFLGYTFIGTQPLSDPSAAQRVDGSSLDRIVVLGLFALALATLAANWRASLSLALRNVGVVGLVLFCLASLAWSDHPDLTIRRAILLVMLTTAAAAVAAGARDLRRMHTLLFVTLAAVALLNLATVVVAPGLAISDLGVKGIYSQKNVAGAIMMVAAVIGASWTLGATDRRSVGLGLLGLAPILLLLVATRSKTSIALAGFALAALLALWLFERLGPRAIALAVTGVAVLAAGFIALVAASGFDVGRLAETLTGDATFTGRDELWKFALEKSLERPWLGHGYGAFWDVGPGADPLLRVDPGSWLGDVETGTINQAHNGYLELWLQVGLPAMVIAAAITLFRSVSSARRFVAEPMRHGDRWMMATLGMILALMLVHNLSEASLFMRGIPLCNVAMLAMFLSSGRHATRPL